MTIQRRQFLSLGGAAMMWNATASLTLADRYPSRSVRIVVATAAGGSNDVVTRLIAQWLTNRLGRSFVVVNRPGGGNNIGADVAAHSPADGYTLFLANSANAINAALYEKLSYDFLGDFTPIVNVVSSPLIMMVHPSVPARTVAQFISYAMANSDKINLASGGNAGIGHLAAELFKMRTGIQFVHIPYSGESLAITDLIAGQAQLLFATSGSSMAQVKAGTVRALAVTTSKRLPALPEVPTVGDSLPGYEVSAWAGLVAPKKTPSDIVEKLNSEVNAALADSTIKQRIAELGATPVGGTPYKFDKFMSDEVTKFAKIVKFADLKAN